MEVQNFSLKIKDKIIFDSVNLTFKQGYLNIIAGKNGVGKTLLIDLISNLDNNRPKEFLNFPPAKNIIYQTQGVPFIAEATVKQTLELLSSISDNSMNLFDQAPEKIKKNKNVRFGNLSGGERRYLIIWASLQIKRELYLLDEPFANLDPSIIEDIFELIYKKIDEGKTIILSTHQFDGAVNHKTYINFLDNKQVLYSGNFEEFKKIFPSISEAFSQS